MTLPCSPFPRSEQPPGYTPLPPSVTPVLPSPIQARSKALERVSRAKSEASLDSIGRAGQSRPGEARPHHSAHEKGRPNASTGPTTPRGYGRSGQTSAQVSRASLDADRFAAAVTVSPIARATSV